MNHNQNIDKQIVDYLRKVKKYNVTKGQKEPTGKINRSDKGFNDNEQEK